mmetsp:Transcript_82399/g.164244  ORF Transcript_82399/g.164244 Transcript_82399/m.164244 type:complete len:143 (+) Transcript_82399:1756-2184(+)
MCMRPAQQQQQQPATSARRVGAPSAEPLSDEQMQQTWRHMQMAKHVQLQKHEAAAQPSAMHVGAPKPAQLDKNRTELQLQAAVQNGTTARLGVGLERPTASFPLGVKSSVTTLGNNYAPIYAKKRHANSQKFTNSFPPDAFF